MSTAKWKKLIPKAKVHHEHRNWAFLLDKMTCLFWILLLNEKEGWLKMSSLVMEKKIWIWRHLHGTKISTWYHQVPFTINTETLLLIFDQFLIAIKGRFTSLPIGIKMTWFDSFWLELLIFFFWEQITEQFHT